MRMFSSFLSHTGLLCLLLLAWPGVANASPALVPPVQQPQIAVVSSTALCSLLPCSVTATLTYNVAVGATPGAAHDFRVVNLTQGTPCPTQNLTRSPVVVGGLNLLLLDLTCSVNSGDRLQLVYQEEPAASRFVYSLRQHSIHAHSPQAIAWTQGSVLGCPPLCRVAAR